MKNYSHYQAVLTSLNNPDLSSGRGGGAKTSLMTKLGMVKKMDSCIQEYWFVEMLNVKFVR